MTCMADHLRWAPHALHNNPHTISGTPRATKTQPASDKPYVSKESLPNSLATTTWAPPSTPFTSQMPRVTPQRKILPSKALKSFLNSLIFISYAMSTSTPQSPPKDTLKDIFLWRRKKLSFSVLVVSTGMWVLLEIFQYTFVTVASWVAISTVISLFVWAHLAALLGKDVPSLSGLEVSEQSAVAMADAVRSRAEDAVRWLFHVTVERNWLLAAQMIAGLWILSLVGSCFDFLTLLYIGVWMGLTLPVLYVKYQDRIQACAERVKTCGRKSSERVKMDGRKLSEMVDEKILRKIKKKVSEEKKTE